MEIIVGHQHTDFDGLAAMIAAKKLYPEAKAVFPGRLQDPVKDFMALYKDEVEIFYLSDIDLKNVNKLIIVDTADQSALGELNKKLDLNEIEVIVYDHHPHKQKDWINFDYSQEVGASVTILIEKIIEKKIELNPLEATICALGIYSDTGSLTYDMTRAKDVKAVSYLLEFGANLEIIRQFLEEALNAEQQKILDNLLENRETLEIDGIQINIFFHEQSNYVTGLNNITEKLKDIYNLKSVFVIVKMGKKVELIGRSNDDAVNVGKICELMGGGGHKGAGAAQLRKNLLEVKDKLKDIIDNNVEPLERVSSIMSTPVRTISPETTIEEAENFLEKYGHNGAVVCDGDKIGGIFSRRDLDKVKGHNLMHAPVKGYMSKNVITVNHDEPIEKAQELMVKYNIGRLPVIKDKKLVGIVTRSDILGSYFDHETPHQYQNRYGSSLVSIERKVIEIKDKLDYFPEKVLNLLKIAGQIAEKENSKLFLIGGMIRDLMLDRENYDLDLVLEGNLKNFLDHFTNEIEAKINYNEQFGTATINLNSKYSIDFATSRKEEYLQSGALPRVEKTNILEDLFRRDYTINALALSLNPDDWGKLYDFFNAREDLKKRQLRALHRFSFLDDPTRIIRGVRLALDLDFNFEKETKKLIKEALKLGDFSELSHARVFKEMKIFFNGRFEEKTLKLIEEFPIFKLIYIDFEFKEKYRKEFLRLKENINKFSKLGFNINKSLLFMAIFFNDIPEENYKELNLNAKERKLFNVDVEKIVNKLTNDLNKVELTKIIGNLNKEELFYVLAVSDNKKLKENVELYYEELRDVTINIDGHDLIELGVEPGPEIKEILQKVWKKKLNKKLETEQEERDFVRKLIKKRLE
ncbi:MAG: CBS domain-containing protein [Bacillota bacterium]